MAEQSSRTRESSALAKKVLKKQPGTSKAVRKSTSKSGEDGKRQHIATGPDVIGTVEAHYRKVAAGLYERAAGKPLNFHTVGQWLEDWLQNTKPTAKPRTYERYKGTVADFINFLGNRRTAPLTSITPEDMVGFREVLSRRDLASSTINICVRKTMHILVSGFSDPGTDFCQWDAFDSRGERIGTMRVRCY